MKSTEKKILKQVKAESNRKQRLTAKTIAAALFTSGFNAERAIRLKLILPGERDGGGWCLKSAIEVIEAHLK